MSSSLAPSATTDEKIFEDKDGVGITLSVISEDLDAEVGYDLYKQTKEEGLKWTKEEERRVLRKIDLWILPLFCFTQGLAFLDKTALNLGNLFGMKADLHTSGSQFSWFASAFYIGYLVFAEPSTWLLQRFHAGKVMGAFVFTWGIVVIPGLGLMTPFWWRLQEQPLRHLTWYCFNGVGSIVGDLLAYGLGRAHVTVPSWALIFLTLGGFTVVWGSYLFLFLPDSPVTARFLDQRQKLIAIKRVAENRTGIKNQQFKRYQMVQALEGPSLSTWLLFLAAVSAQIPNGVLSNFSRPSLGFGLYETILLDIPSSMLQILSLVVSGWVAAHVPNARCVMMFVGNVTCIIAGAVLTYGPNDQRWGRLVAFWFTSFASVGFSLSLVMVSANVGGFTKRQVTAVITFIVSLARPTNITGPHTLLDSEAEIGYPTATKAMMAGSAAKCGFHVILGLYMYFENLRRDRLAEREGYAVPEDVRVRLAEEEGMKDVTERDNKWFRYVL
ncbi:MFS general substrate transporter [Vararia minispora EC-137]|uniref:MFS general substrate transporter n=1 Tax=Vararia minispora EC-137 TaxID=1314806 RepID=A0ACB8Q8E3_9AGAM|nr:MFS general substrate transporter [Vararia minispora EC-137]